MARLSGELYPKFKYAMIFARKIFPRRGLSGSGAAVLFDGFEKGNLFWRQILFGQDHLLLTSRGIAQRQGVGEAIGLGWRARLRRGSERANSAGLDQRF